MLSGILPISRVSAIPLCVYHAARLVPLEKVLGLAHPSLSSPAREDKRTWREGMRPVASGAGDAGQGQHKEVVWTAMDILTSYATKKGWVTAKAGRPDVNRAGNASTCTISPSLIVAVRDPLTVCTLTFIFCPLRHGLICFERSVIHAMAGTVACFWGHVPSANHTHTH